jgi:hypothetical protein
VALQTRVLEKFCSCQWGDKRTAKHAQTVSEDPHRRERVKYTYSGKPKSLLVNPNKSLYCCSLHDSKPVNPAVNYLQQISHTV